jgi:hypothetical protein
MPVQSFPHKSSNITPRDPMCRLICVAGRPCGLSEIVVAAQAVFNEGSCDNDYFFRCADVKI